MRKDPKIFIEHNSWVLRCRFKTNMEVAKEEILELKKKILEIKEKERLKSNE